MSCQKTLILAPAANPMPLDDAVVFNDKVYGMMGPYILRFAGDTGALEASARVAAPMLGDCRITELGGVIYVSTWNNPAVPGFNFTGSIVGQNGIYPVDATTLAAGAMIDLNQIYAISSPGSNPLIQGPRFMLGHGAYLYVTIFTPSGVQTIRINPLNVADRSTLTALPGTTFSATQQFAIDTAGSKIYVPLRDDIQQENLDGTGNNTVDTGTDMNIAVAFDPASTSTYSVSGSATLNKIVWGPDTVSTFNLAALQAGVLPFRIKYNAGDGLIYIPCQSQDCVIVWNPATDTGTVQSEFTSPIDCVFTSTKKWAVCNGITPLQEIA